MWEDCLQLKMMTEQKLLDMPQTEENAQLTSTLRGNGRPVNRRVNDIIFATEDCLLLQTGIYDTLM